MNYTTLIFARKYSSFILNQILQEKLLKIGHIFEQTIEGYSFIPPLVANESTSWSTCFCVFITKSCASEIILFIVQFRLCRQNLIWLRWKSAPKQILCLDYEIMYFQFLWFWFLNKVIFNNVFMVHLDKISYFHCNLNIPISNKLLKTKSSYIYNTFWAGVLIFKFIYFRNFHFISPLTSIQWGFYFRSSTNYQPFDIINYFTYKTYISEYIG